MTSRLLVIDAIWSEDLYIVQTVWQDAPNQLRRTEISSTRRAADFVALMTGLANAMSDGLDALGANGQAQMVADHCGLGRGPPRRLLDPSQHP